jgi:hypothetical protein
LAKKGKIVIKHYFKFWINDPNKLGMITAGLAFSALVFVNLIDVIFLDARSIFTSWSVVSALIAAGCSGVLLKLFCQKLETRYRNDMNFAKSIANGELLSTIADLNNNPTELSFLLTQIATEQLMLKRVHKQKLTELLVENRTRLSALDALQQGVLFYDQNNILLYINKTYVKMCDGMGLTVEIGMSQEDHLKQLSQKFPINEQQLWVEGQLSMRIQALKSGVTMRAFNASDQPVQVSIRSVEGGGKIEIVENISAIVQLENAIHAEKQKTTSIDRLKKDISSRLNYTITTPMTGVLTASELLRTSKLDDTQRTRVDIIKQSTETILSVVHDIVALLGGVETTIKALHKQALICATPTNKARQIKAFLTYQGFEVDMFEPFIHAEPALQLWEAAAQKKAGLMVFANDRQKSQMLATKDKIAFEPCPEIKLFSEFLLEIFELEARKAG